MISLNTRCVPQLKPANKSISVNTDAVNIKSLKKSDKIQGITAPTHNKKWTYCVDDLVTNQLVMVLNQSLGFDLSIKTNPDDLVKNCEHLCKYLLDCGQFTFDDQMINLWNQFLSEHKEKLDPIAKLNRDLSRVDNNNEKLEMINRLIYKNTSCVNEGYLSKFIYHIVVIKKIRTINEAFDMLRIGSENYSVLSYDPIENLKNKLSKARSYVNKNRLVQEFVSKSASKHCKDYWSKELLQQLENSLIYYLKRKGISNSYDLISIMDRKLSLVLCDLIYNKENGHNKKSVSDFCQFFSNHFYRNLNKLGLDFCSSQSINIVFLEKKFDDFLDSRGLDYINKNPWKIKQRRLGNVCEYYSYSIIRHAIRNRSAVNICKVNTRVEINKISLKALVLNKIYSSSEFNQLINLKS